MQNFLFLTLNLNLNFDLAKRVKTYASEYPELIMHDASVKTMAQFIWCENSYPILKNTVILI